MDEILIEIETDKVVLEVPAPAAGVLAELVEADGATVAAEQVIARIDTERPRPAPRRPRRPDPRRRPRRRTGRAIALRRPRRPARRRGVAMPAAAKLMAEHGLAAQLGAPAPARTAA